MKLHETKLAKQAKAELLQQIEDNLVHSRELISQINDLLVQRQANLRRAAAGGFRI